MQISQLISNIWILLVVHLLENSHQLNMDTSEHYPPSHTHIHLHLHSLCSLCVRTCLYVSTQLFLLTQAEVDGRFEGPQLTLCIDTIQGSKIPAEACDIWNSNVWLSSRMPVWSSSVWQRQDWLFWECVNFVITWAA